MAFMDGGRGINSHGAEFQAPEPFAEKPDSFLPEENRSWRNNPDYKANESPNEEPARRSDNDKRNIQDSFPKRNHAGKAVLGWIA